MDELKDKYKPINIIGSYIQRIPDDLVKDSGHVGNGMTIRNKNVLKEEVAKRAMIWIGGVIEGKKELSEVKNDISVMLFGIVKKADHPYFNNFDSIFDQIKQDKFLTTDEKIELWIDEHIPNSPNKQDYKRAFQVICKQTNPKECGRTFLLEKIHEEFEPSIGDQSLRKKIPDFKNTFPF